MPARAHHYAAVCASSHHHGFLCLEPQAATRAVPGGSERRRRPSKTQPSGMASRRSFRVVLHVWVCPDSSCNESRDSLRGHRASGGVAGLRLDTRRRGTERASGRRKQVDAPTTSGTPMALGPICPARRSLPPKPASRRMRGCLFPSGATKQIDC